MKLPPIVDLFETDIQRVLDRYTGQGITISEVLGVFEITKTRLIMHALTEQNDEGN